MPGEDLHLPDEVRLWAHPALASLAPVIRHTQPLGSAVCRTVCPQVANPSTLVGSSNNRMLIQAARCS